MKSFGILSVLVAGFAAVASAYTTPTVGPKGNSIIKPGLGERVPVGKPYTITWIPDAPGVGTVDLILLRGPSENILPLYAIVEKAPNTGTYVWTPKTDLEDDVTHYGIQLIQTSDGQFQWSTQFGILNPDGPDVTSTTTATVDATKTVTSDVETVTVTGSSTSGVLTSTTSHAGNLTTTAKPKTTSTTEAPETSTTEEATSTLITSTLVSNATSTKSASPTVPVPTNAAGKTAASLGMGLVAVAVAGFSLF